jgi:hypothetical protein
VRRRRFHRIMIRRLLNLVTVLSLLLCVAVVALWVRGSRVRDEWNGGAGQVGWSFTSDHGRLSVTRTWPAPPVPRHVRAELAALDVPAKA